MVHRINDHEPQTAPAALSDEQFAELKALLQPGFELSTLMLAEYKMAHQQPADAPADPTGTSLGITGNAEG